MIVSLRNLSTMENDRFEVEAFTPFSESLIWQLNRDYYQQTGIDAWSSGVVPHNMTSNSMVGKTYAELLLGFLKDVAAKGQTKETVYILELGAGHGRFAFHVLKHLERLIALTDIKLPPYCYILSDIVEESLVFFKNHPQLQPYLQQGILDIAYFDAIEGKEIHLQHANKTIQAKDLNQPLVAIANYFFDSLPNDLIHIQKEGMDICSIALASTENPKEVDTTTLLKALQVTYQKTPLQKDHYPQALFNELVASYKDLVSDTHLFFPKKGLECLGKLLQFSDKGLMVLSMDKGFHELRDLDNRKEPEIIIHGSFSLWVNYHAYRAFCEKKGGTSLFPAFASFQLEIGCLLFVDDAAAFQHTNAAYERFVNDFGPDDYTSIKKTAYRNISKLTLVDLLTFIRLSVYDSTFFLKILPRLKQVAQSISHEQRGRLVETLHEVWQIYFNINEPHDLAYEIGGMLYDLGAYSEALTYFQYSTAQYGKKDDIYYNRILCYYQLRKDDLFKTTLKEAKLTFPKSTLFAHLDKLDLTAA